MPCADARLERAFREPELDADPHSLPVSSVLSCGVAPVYLVFDQPRPTSRCGDGVYGAEGVYCYRVFHLSPRGSALGTEPPVDMGRPRALVSLCACHLEPRALPLPFAHVRPLGVGLELGKADAYRFDAALVRVLIDEAVPVRRSRVVVDRCLAHRPVRRSQGTFLEFAYGLRARARDLRRSALSFDRSEGGPVCAAYGHGTPCREPFVDPRRALAHVECMLVGFSFPSPARPSTCGCRWVRVLVRRRRPQGCRCAVLTDTGGCVFPRL